jgi:hypothetical protein
MNYDVDDKMLERFHKPVFLAHLTSTAQFWNLCPESHGGLCPSGKSLLGSISHSAYGSRGPA